MAEDEINLVEGRTVAMDHVRKYFDYLFNAEESGDPFPVDFDAVWPLAYATKANAKRALTAPGEFYEGVDYRLIKNAEPVRGPDGTVPGGWNREQILLSIQCMEFFVARKVRAVFEVYRQCRIAASEAARARVVKAQLPYHLRRYLANHDQVPFGYFSILQEITTKLVGPLEMRGYTLPEKMMPDISVGRIFCKWLREVKGIDPETFPTYNHTFEDARVVQARAYPVGLLSDFVVHFQEEWMKNRAEKYFKERDDTAIEYLAKILQAPANVAALPTP